MTTYLERRGAVYRFRRVVPHELRPCFLTSTGKERTEFSFSLGTKDRREAERLCRIKSVETDALLDQARANLKAGGSQHFRHSPPMPAMSGDDLEQMELRSQANLEADSSWEKYAANEDAVLTRVLGDGHPQMVALRNLLDPAHLLTPSEKRQRQLDQERSWSEGEAEFVREWGHARSIDATPAYPALMALFEAYVVEGSPQPATVKRWRPVIAHLIAFLGHDDASKLTTADVRAWRQSLALEKVVGGGTRAARTIRETYLAALKVVLSVAVENGKLPDNVASAVTIRVPKSVRLRDPEFTDAEALRILRASLSDTPVNLASGHALARRWVPWICAYSGARVNEITQLRAEDIYEQDGVWAMRITPEAGSVKNKAARVVPLHSHLVEQGFPALAKAKGAGPLFYDPALGRGGSDGNPQHKKIGERLAKWVRAIGVSDPNVQPNHAWRHLFITRARAVGMDAEARDAIPGHASATEGHKYGTRPLLFLSSELEKLPRFLVAIPS